MAVQISTNDREVSQANPFPVAVIGQGDEGTPAEVVTATPTGTFALVVPFTLLSGDNTLVADPGDGFQAGLVYGLFKNNDTVRRTLILKHGSTVFADVDIEPGGSLAFNWEHEYEYWFAAASTAITYNASAGSAIKLASGKSFVRVARASCEWRNNGDYRYTVRSSI